MRYLNIYFCIDRFVKIIFFYFFLLWSGQIMAQTPPSTQKQPAPFYKLEKVKADLAVPDAPAFKVLDADPSNIMRPSNVRAVSVVIANFLSGGAILPNTFAAEFSPGLIFGTSLSAYQKKPCWYRMRFSIGTKAKGDSARDIGIGLRITIVDKTDLRTDKQLEKKLFEESGKPIVRSTVTATENVLNKTYENPSGSEIGEHLKQDQDYQNKMKQLDSAIVAARERAKKENWNKPIVEFGMAIRGSSLDSLAKNLVASQYGLWLSGGFPLGKKGQLLLGEKAALTRNSNKEFKNGENSLGLRAYYGENEHKVLAELDWVVKSKALPSYGFNVGYESGIISGFWFDLSIGLQKQGTADPKVTSSFNLRIATPE